MESHSSSYNIKVAQSMIIEETMGASIWRSMVDDVSDMNKNKNANEM